MKVTVWILTLFLITQLIYSNSALAVQSRIDGSKLTYVRPMSSDMVQNPKLSGFTRIYFTPGTWSPASDCRNTAGEISNADTHILSVVLSALAMDKEISVFVESTLVPDPRDNFVCQVVAVQMAP